MIFRRFHTEVRIMVSIESVILSLCFCLLRGGKWIEPRWAHSSTLNNVGGVSEVWGWSLLPAMSRKNLQQFFFWETAGMGGEEVHSFLKMLVNFISDQIVSLHPSGSDHGFLPSSSRLDATLGHQAFFRGSIKSTIPWDEGRELYY